jgi:hypothetical protein
MGIANPGVFLQRRDPGHLHGRRQDALAQGGDLLALRQEAGADGENRA